MAAVEAALAAARAAGRPILVSYVMGGIRDDWADLLAAMIDAGADAVEIGLPFSDPMLDGPIIQQASAAAIDHGATLSGILAQLAARTVSDVPLVAMTYANHVYRRGVDNYCRELADAGISGAIVPDLPVGEADEYLEAAAKAGLDATLMVTPATPDEQIGRIADRSRGFLYVMSVMATTGPARGRDQASAWAVADAARRYSPRPVLIGFGIDTPDRAVAAAGHADGVVVASTLMRQVLDGATVGDISRAVADLRAGLDQAWR
ncbi:MAG TPA: tryptophan synthase subunit alpha [Streptosporangiaceae bacterium]